MDVLLLPNHSRPEFLTITLELIEKNSEINDLYFIYTLDLGFRRSLLDVISNFHKRNPTIQYEVIEIPKVRLNRITKQSHALFTGYKRALEISTGLIFMIEDDIFISNQFFKFHREAQKYVDVTIATKNVNQKIETNNSPSHFYITKNTYQSLGVCFKRRFLHAFMSTVDNLYYQDPIRYCKLNYPDSTIGLSFIEQDGIFHRYIKKYNQHVAFPHYPHAYHAGYFGMHRGKRETGSLDEKIRKIRSVAFDPVTMKRRILEMGNPVEYFKDSTPVNLNHDDLLMEYESI